MNSGISLEEKTFEIPNALFRETKNNSDDVSYMVNRFFETVSTLRKVVPDSETTKKMRVIFTRLDRHANNATGQALRDSAYLRSVSKQASTKTMGRKILSTQNVYYLHSMFFTLLHNYDLTVTKSSTIPSGSIVREVVELIEELRKKNLTEEQSEKIRQLEKSIYDDSEEIFKLADTFLNSRFETVMDELREFNRSKWKR